MKVLIVDNNLHVGGYPQGLMVRFHLGMKAAINSLIRSPNRLSKKDLEVDRVILTGSAAYIRQESAWMRKEDDFIGRWIDKNIPILGICFGGQLLGKHLFGSKAVKALPVPISGSILVKHSKNCKLFNGLPNPLGVVSTHYEGFEVPKKYRIAKIEEWDSYGFSYKNFVFGIQFHPELMGFPGRTLVRLQRAIFDRHVYQDFSVKTSSKHGRRIFQNFLNI